MSKLAELADKVMEVATPIMAATNFSPPDTELAQLRQEVTCLTELVYNCSTHVNLDTATRPETSILPAPPNLVNL